MIPRLLFVALLVACDGPRIPDAGPQASASVGPQPAPGTVEVPVSTSTHVPLQPEMRSDPGDPKEPPGLWAVSYAISSTFSQMSYEWSVGPKNAGELRAVRKLDPKNPGPRNVKFRATDAALRALKANLSKDDCCTAWRASTCLVNDAPPAEIHVAMGELQCAARATPECTQETRAQRCFDHLRRFVDVACGTRCN